MASETQQDAGSVLPLGTGAIGLRGIVVAVGRQGENSPAPKNAFDEELERRLLEIGFVEGASVEILHEGFLGKDPIAVRVDDMSIALRRREANAILVQMTSGDGTDKPKDE